MERQARKRTQLGIGTIEISINLHTTLESDILVALPLFFFDCFPGAMALFQTP